MAIPTQPEARWPVAWHVGWWHPLIWGIASIGLGVFLIAQPALSAIALVTIVAVFWLVGGLVDVVEAVMSRSHGWGWHLAGGILGALVGVFVLGHPLFGTVVTLSVLYVLIGASILIRGAIGVYSGLGSSFGRIVLGVLQLAIGILLLLGPLSLLTLASLVQALGILAIAGGLSEVVLAFNVRPKAPATV